MGIYEDRTKVIGAWLTNVLRRYTPPSGMDDNTLREELNFIVEDVNKNIPTQFDALDISSVLTKTDGHVRATHGPRTWPSVKTFIESTKKAVDTHSRHIAIPSVTTNDVATDLQIIAKKIRNGDPIPDYVLVEDSPYRIVIMEETGITPQDFNKYLAPEHRV